MGISSPDAETDLYYSNFNLTPYAQKIFYENFYFRLGWQWSLYHFDHSEGGAPPTGLNGFSNNFDSGPWAALFYDNRDSQWDPYRGRLVLLQGFFPSIFLGSSNDYQRVDFGWDEYFYLSLKYTLRISLAIKGDFANSPNTVPYWDNISLSGSIAVPAVRLNRYQNLTGWASWFELRSRDLEPLTLFLFGSIGTVSNSFPNLYSEIQKTGFGLGVEAALSRYRGKAMRVELGTFGGEWSLTGKLGLPIEL
jgi:hypothetical protein